MCCQTIHWFGLEMRMKVYSSCNRPSRTHTDTHRETRGAKEEESVNIRLIKDNTEKNMYGKLYMNYGKFVVVLHVGGGMNGIVVYEMYFNVISVKVFDVECFPDKLKETASISFYLTKNWAK